MDISLSEDQMTITAAVRDLLSDAWSREKMRAYLEAAPNGDDGGLWSKLVQSDFPAILAPEEYDGGGATIIDVTPIIEQFGYVLAPTRFTTSAIVSTYAVTGCEDSELKKRLLDGTTKLTTVIDENLTVQQDGDSITLSGTARYVPDVQGSTHAIVLHNDVVAVVDLADAAGIRVVTENMVDQTRSISHINFDRVTVKGPDQLTATAGNGELIARVNDVRMLVTIADSLGGAARALDMAVQYSTERHQFGKPIGSFQSLQHLMADAYVAIENLRSATWYAAHAIHTQADDREFAVLAASVLATKTYLKVSDLNIQVHGGMGFTVEVDAYLYAARAKVNELQDGSLAARINRIAEWLRTTELAPLVEYLGGQRRQIDSSMFAIA